MRFNSEAAFVLSLLLLFIAHPLYGAQPPETKKILVLASYHPSAPVGSLWTRGIRSVIESGTTLRTDIDIEHLDVLRFKGERYAQLQLDLLSHKYAASPPHLVIAIYNTALDFMLTHGPDIFPGVPVVFAGIEPQFIDTQKLGSNITGLLSSPSYTQSLDLALDLHPNTQHVAVVSGAGKIGRRWSLNAMQAFQPYRARIDFIDLTGLPMPVILEKIADLPKRSVIMHITLLEDGAGNRFTATQSVHQISQATNAPVYSFWDLMLGHGIVGGYLSSAAKKGEAAAVLALRILDGEQPADIPPIKEGPLKAMFDWRELRRWSIEDSRLPTGSTVKFKTLSSWEKNKSQIISGLVLIISQGLAIAYLLYQRQVRIRSELRLAERLAFEQLFSRLSTDFIRLPADQTESKIIDSLAQVGKLLNADRAFLFRFNWEKTRFFISHLWESGSTDPDGIVRGSIVKDFIPWAYNRLIKGKEVIVPDVEALPAMNADEEYEYCRQIGIRSFLMIPLQVADGPLCAIGLDAIRTKRKWPEAVKDRLRLIGEIFANAIERMHSEKRGKVAEQKFQTVADRTYDWEYWERPDGSIEYVSPSCERISGYTPQDFVRHPALLRDIILPIDQQRWDAHRCEAAKPKDPENEFLLFRIQNKNGGLRWIEHVCQPVFDPQGQDLGVRVSNRDITQREQFKSESQELQSELAHIDRVVTISAMTTALAHEINQPLAAMRSYAQAALRFLDADKPDNANIRKALLGVVADNKRASAVVNRLRDLVKKKTSRKEKLDVNQLINDVLSLINSEIVIRDTVIKTDLELSIPAFKGDSVQIQQVLMNLLTNAMDAMDQVPVERRIVTIVTRLENARQIVVSIVDAGQGVAPQRLNDIFSPFHSTKAKGLGLGLAISRSIINTHGGSITAKNNPDGGATFALVLPVAESGI